MTTTMTDQPAPMRDGETAAAYTRRTGHYPPQWSINRCRAQDTRLSDAQRAGATAYLRQWGAEND